MTRAGRTSAGSLIAWPNAAGAPSASSARLQNADPHMADSPLPRGAGGMRVREQRGAYTGGAAGAGPPRGGGGGGGEAEKRGGSSPGGPGGAPPRRFRPGRSDV